MEFKSEKAPELDLIEVEGVGSFDKSALKGKSKSELQKHFAADHGMNEADAVKHADAVYSEISGTSEETDTNIYS